MPCIYLLHSRGGPRSSDFDITLFDPIIVTPYPEPVEETENAENTENTYDGVFGFGLTNSPARRKE